jgi:hypothetical protein
MGQSVSFLFLFLWKGAVEVEEVEEVEVSEILVCRIPY